MSATEDAEAEDNSASKSDVKDELGRLAEYIREHGDADSLSWKPHLDQLKYDPEDGGTLEISFVAGELRLRVIGGGLRGKHAYDLDEVYTPEARMVSYSPRYGTPQFRFHVGEEYGETVKVDVPDANHDRREG